MKEIEDMGPAETESEEEINYDDLKKQINNDTKSRKSIGKSVKNKTGVKSPNIEEKSMAGKSEAQKSAKTPEIKNPQPMPSAKLNINDLGLDDLPKMSDKSLAKPKPPSPVKSEARSNKSKVAS